MGKKTDALPNSNLDMPLSKEMRKVTRDVHDLSDALVNAKLLLAMSDTNIWIEGLLIFYEIFKFLEASMVDCKDNKFLRQFDLPEMKRTEAFESDLAHYLGSDWKAKYEPRESVVKYLAHLEELKQNNATLLIAYVYQMYLGVLSGGQIINKKRHLSPFPASYQDQVLYFPPNTDVPLLKRQIKTILDEQSSELSRNTREELLAESRLVFLLNNSIIKSIDSSRITYVLLKKLLYVIVIGFLLKKLLDYFIL